MSKEEKTPIKKKISYGIMAFIVVIVITGALYYQFSFDPTETYFVDSGCSTTSADCFEITKEVHLNNNQTDWTVKIKNYIGSSDPPKSP